MIVPVEQDCNWSCCTHALLDVQALGNVASDYSTRANVSQSNGNQLGQSEL